MALRRIEENDDARYELPDHPVRWDWGMFLANALGTAANCLQEASEFVDACGGMLSGDYSARRFEREARQQGEISLAVERIHTAEDI